MLYMNSHEIAESLRLTDASGDLIARRGVGVLIRLVYWTDNNSDGWSSWPKPARAAAKLMQLLQDHNRVWRNGGEPATTRGELTNAVAPIKSFLTRQGVPADVKQNIIEGVR